MTDEQFPNIKIFGLTKVGPKGQVIIPKECRDDLSMFVGEEFEVIMIDRKTFGIGRTDKMVNFDFLKNFESIETLWNISLGTKYQFVIPSTVRKILGIRTGDNLLVLGKQSGLGFIKNDNLEFLFTYLKKIYAAK